MNLKPIAVLLLILTSLAFFSKTARYGFVWKDNEKIVDIFQDHKLTAKELWTGNQAMTFAPLTYSAWQGISSFSRTSHESGTSTLDPHWFHLINIFTHTVAAIALLFLLDLVFSNLLAAWMGATLFLLHPVQAEAVSLAYGLKTTLGGALGILAVWQYLVFSKANTSYNRDVRGRATRNYLVATFLFVLAILANPIAVTLPFFAVILERILPGQRSLLSERRPKGPISLWFILTVPVIILAMSHEAPPAEATGIFQRPFVFAATLTMNLIHFFAPFRLAPDYGLSPSVMLQKWWGYAAILIPVFLTGALLWWREKPRTWYAAALALFTVALLPTGGLFSYGFQSVSVVSDRYMYLPIAALAIGFSYAMTAKRNQMVQFLGFAALIATAYLTRTQVAIWSNPGELWSHTALVNPASTVARIELGRKSLADGKAEDAYTHFSVVAATGHGDAKLLFQLATVEMRLGKSADAIAHFRRAIEMFPTMPRAHTGLGKALVESGRAAEALPVFEQAIALNAQDSEALISLGMLEETAGKLELARDYMTKTLETNPQNALAHAILGRIDAKLGRTDEAIQHLKASIEGKIEQPETHLILAGVLYSQGEMDEAANHYAQALKTYPENFEAHNNLGAILLQKKQFEQGLQHIQEASRLSPGDPLAIQNMAIAMFHLRRYHEAQQYFTKAIAITPKLPNAWFYQGEMARYQGDKLKARGFYYSALRYDTNHADAHSQLGNLLLQEEKFDRAVTHFEASLKSRPNSEKVQASLQRAKRLLDRKGG